MSQLIWFRTDLRVRDNTALHAAMQAGPTIALYLLSPGQWRVHQDAPGKIHFWLRNLACLRDELARLGVPLLIRSASHWEQAPQVLAELCRELRVRQVQVNEEYGVSESRRDRAVAACLAEQDTGFRSHVDQLLFPPGSILTRSGGYFQVYSQFRKVCYQRLHATLPIPVALPKPQMPLALSSDPVPVSMPGFATPNPELQVLWPAGEQAALERLTRFTDERMDDYERDRDLPAHSGTSQLSPYLTAGVLSPRQCLHAALRNNQGEFDSGNPGAISWINELLWREFYKHILVGFPQVSMHRALRMHRLRMQLHAECMHHLHHRLEARLGTGCKGFVQAFTAEAGILGYLAHAAGLGHMADGLKQLIGIAFSQHLGQVLSNHLLAVEVVSQVKLCDYRFHSISPTSFLASSISRAWDGLSPPQSNSNLALRVLQA